MSRNSSTALGNVPKEVQEHVRNLLSITPTLRPDVHVMSKVRAPVRLDLLQIAMFICDEDVSMGLGSANSYKMNTF